jgi:hypothetical protein
VQRKAKIVSFALVGGVLLAVILAPTLLSTQAGSRFLLKQLSNGESIEAAKLDLSWLGSQSADGMKYKKGELTFTCSHLAISTPLWKLLLSRHFFGKVAITKGNVEIVNGNIGALSFHDIELALTIPESNSLSAINASGKTSQNGKSGTFNVQGTIDLSTLATPHFDLQARLIDLPIQGIDQMVAMANPKLKGLLTQAIGPSLNLDLKAKASSQTFEMDLSGRGAQFTTQLKTKREQDRVVLAEPAELSLQLTPALAKEIGARFFNAPNLTLKGDSTFTLTLGQLSIPITQQGIDLSALAFRCDAQIAPLLFEPDAAVEGLKVTLSSHHIQDEISAQLTGALKQETFQSKLDASGRFKLFPSFSLAAPLQLTYSAGDQILDASINRLIFSQSNFFLAFTATPRGAGQIQGEISANNFDDPAKRILDYRVSTRDFPTTFFAPWAGGQSVAFLLSPTLNLLLEGRSSGKIHTAALKASSATLSLDADLKMDGNTLELSNPAKPVKAQLLLSKEGFGTIAQMLVKRDGKPLGCELTQDCMLNMSLSSLSIPLAPFSIAHVLAKGSLQIDTCSLLEKRSSELFTLRNLLFSLSRERMSSPLLCHLSGNVASSGSNAPSKEKQLRIDAELTNMFSEKGEIDMNRFTASVDASVQDFPTVFLDAALRLVSENAYPPSSLIGPTLSATAKASIKEWSGPIMLNMNAENSRLSLSGNINSGILTLTEPAHAQLTVTSELSTLLLNEVNPLSISAIAARNPLTLQIPAENFSFPLHPFDIKAVTIPTATLEFGKIRCENQGNLSLALSLLKAKSFSKEKELRLWFAPVVVHIKEGILNCERTEILVADTYEIATWGKVDLAADYIDMVLGLTAQCLHEAFGVKNLPRDYVLQIPMKGPSNNVKINTGAATAKIAALIAWQQRANAGGFGGGLQGALMGELLGTLGVRPDKDTSYPPAKHPFPWETTPPETKKSKKSTSKRAIKKDDKPLKQLMKILK